MKISLVAAAMAMTTVACAEEGAAPLPEIAARAPEAEDASSERIDLGELTPGSEATFEIPAGTLGFNVTVEGDDAAQIGVESLVSPSGEKVVDGFFLAGSTPDERMAVIGGRGASAVSVPQSNATATRPVEHGTWKLVASGIVPDATKGGSKSSAALPNGAPSTRPLRVTVAVQRTSDGEFHGGELDLHVWIPDGLRIHDPEPLHEVKGATAKDDRAIAKRVDTFYADLEELFGIERGNVTFHAIDQSFLSATSGDARAATTAQAKGDGARALHVVFTNHLAYGEGDSILGYSGGIPGSAFANGTVRSSILVALYDGETAANDALTILHEMGHFVGLMHSEDYDGTPDLLADTPNQDTRNLMAPDGPRGGTVVSPSQVRIMRGSAIYRAKRVR